MKLLRPYLRSLEGPATLPAPAQVAIARLVAALCAPGRSARVPAAARLALMQETIAHRAAEPGLRMADVAAAAGVSERRGHQLLAASGLTFGEVVTAQRLDRVAAALSTGAPGTIVALALSAGFSDVSRFNGLFRDRFGQTPGNRRRGSAG